MNEISCKDCKMFVPKNNYCAKFDMKFYSDRASFCDGFVENGTIFCTECGNVTKKNHDFDLSICNTCINQIGRFVLKHLKWCDENIGRNAGYIVVRYILKRYNDFDKFNPCRDLDAELENLAKNSVYADANDYMPELTRLAIEKDITLSEAYNEIFAQHKINNVLRQCEGQEFAKKRRKEKANKQASIL